ALVVAGQLSEFPLATFEPDNDPVTISNDFSPIGSALIDSTNGAGSFIYNPDAFDVGAAIPIQFFATDPAGASDTVATVFVVRAFLRGDANTDTRVDLTDIVFLIDFIFRSGVPPVSFDAADADFDSRIRITDVTFLINYLYRNGPPPPN
ncbi:MAG: dockerin type I domain-containing protein, partial [Candidatus Zixiibacteriota bacterium]